MLTLHITEADSTGCTTDDTGSPAGLASCLAQYGVSPHVIQTVLDALPQVKTVVLCKPSDADAWEIAAPRGLML